VEKTFQSPNWSKAKTSPVYTHPGQTKPFQNKEKMQSTKRTPHRYEQTLLKNINLTICCIGFVMILEKLRWANVVLQKLILWSFNKTTISPWLY
jgi:hypothetical protein